MWLCCPEADACQQQHERAGIRDGVALFVPMQKAKQASCTSPFPPSAAHLDYGIFPRGQ